MDTGSIISKLRLEREEIEKAILLLESQERSRGPVRPLRGGVDRRLDGPVARGAISVIRLKTPGRSAE